MSHPASSPISDEVAVLDVVNTFLSCIKKRDKSLMLSLILPAGGATLLRRGKPLHMSLEDVVNRIPLAPDHPTILDEQAYNSKVLIDVSHSIFVPSVQWISAPCLSLAQLNVGTQTPIMYSTPILWDVKFDIWHVQDDIAMAWTPYVFYEDKVLHHTGTNIFTLLKQEHTGKWVISGVADVAREVVAPST
jgi:hypothetical protein